MVAKKMMIKKKYPALGHRMYVHRTYHTFSQNFKVYSAP
jgi:hypothetical protein